MSVAINTLALEVAQKINDDVTYLGANFTVGTEDGQRYSASARRTYINNANIELYNYLKALLSETKKSTTKLLLLKAYTTKITHAFDNSATYDYDAGDYEKCIYIDAKMYDGTNTSYVAIPETDAAESKIYNTLQNAETWYQNGTNFFLFGKVSVVLSGAPEQRSYLIKPPTLASAGTDLTLRDSHKDLLLDIILKNIYIDLKQYDYAQAYVESIKTKLQVLLQG